MYEVRSILLGEFCSFRYGKMPVKANITNDNSLYPIYSGYRIAGYYREANVEEGQLIVVARGVGGTGDVKLTPSKCYLTNLSIAIDVDERVAYREYLYYYFQMSNLRYLDSGSAQSQITISDLQNVRIPIPSLSNQEAIIAILKSLDDKIANNIEINHHLKQSRSVTEISPDISRGRRVSRSSARRSASKSLNSNFSIRQPTNASKFLSAFEFGT